MFEEEDKTFIRETFSTHANEIKKEVKTEISSIKKEMASFNNRCHDTHKEVDDRINSNSTKIIVLKTEADILGKDHKLLSNRFWGFIAIAVVASICLILKTALS